MRRDVRILLVGDGGAVLLFPLKIPGLMINAEGVGKSTIVTSLIKESFVAHVRICFYIMCLLVDVVLGPTYCPRSYHSARSDAGECHDIYCGLRR